MREAISQVLRGVGLAEDWVVLGSDTIEVAIIVLAAWLGHFITRRFIVAAAHRIAARTESDIDDRFVRERVFSAVAHLVPALTAYISAPLLIETVEITVWVRRGAQLYALLAVLGALNRALTVGRGIYEELEIARRFPIRLYVQVARILLAVGAVILGGAILTGQPAGQLLVGLSAMTAVLLLVSKDSILGFLAGIQLVSNDMVRPGDWIEVPEHGADGDVLEINLHVVKVQNWDKTLVSVPTYSMFTNGFKNWRGMSDSGGRRIKRSILIDVRSIEFCSAELLAELKRIAILGDEIQRKEAVLAEHNQALGVDGTVKVNGRRLTNVGVFRRYLVNYLRNHPRISQEMTLLVRQLQPTERGLPLEIYCFANDTRWDVYESIQADIFDHIFAVLPHFRLRAFQAPGGGDVESAGKALTGLVPT